MSLKSEIKKWAPNLTVGVWAQALPLSIMFCMLWVTAQSSLDLSNTRYTGGVTSYLEVTIAQSAALSDEVTAVNILGRRMANTVLLIQALGGGWDRSSLPSRPECCGKLVSSASSSGVNSGSPR